MLETLLQPHDTEERCGVVLSDDTVVEIKNIAEEPANSFEMEPMAFLALYKTGQVVGTWHTHPDGLPVLSGADYSTFQAWPDLKHSVIGREGGQIKVLTYHTKDGVLVLCD